MHGNTVLGWWIVGRGGVRGLGLVVVPGTCIARGLPLMCDTTCVSLVTVRGAARRGALPEMVMPLGWHNT